MNKKMKLSLSIITFIFFVSTPSYAYLDPGTLSIIFAFIVSIFTTILFYIKQIIRFIKEKVFKKKIISKSE
mgnify:FL=1